MPAGMVIHSVEDTVALVLKIFETATHEIVYLVRPSVLSIAGTYDTAQSAKQFIQNGGVIRGITTITHANVEEARIRVAIGEDLRHSDQSHELSMFVGDKHESVSTINVGVDEYTLDSPVTAFWNDDPVYAEYLLTSFESAWSQGVPAEERIQALLEQGEQQH